MSDWTIRRISVTTLASGSDVNLYVHELVGRGGDGPLLGISAAIHGDEAVGTEILFHLRKHLDAATMRGRVWMLPVANPLSYQGNTRNTPLDMTNLNRVFPGDPGGWFTEQLADLLTREYFSKLDALLDFHAGGAYPTVDYIYVINDEKLSRAFGSRYLYKPVERYPGTAAGIVQANGKPAVVIELGGGDVAQGEYIARGIDGVLNCMKTLGMVPGEPKRPPAQVVLHELTILRPRKGGLLIPEVTELGAELGPDAVLGRIYHPQTFEELEVIRAPHRRNVTILLHQTADVVEPGIYGYMIGNLDTATV